MEYWVECWLEYCLQIVDMKGLTIQPTLHEVNAIVNTLGNTFRSTRHSTRQRQYSSQYYSQHSSQ